MKTAVRRCARTVVLALARSACLAAALLGSGAAASDEYLIDFWDTETGLPNSSVTSIAQTPDGYLWAGTYNGLVRFDGVRFAVFDPDNTPALRSARVENLFVDAEGALWINTYDGSLAAWRDGAFVHEWTGGGSVDYGAWLASSRAGRVAFVLETGDVIRRGTGAPSQHAWRPLHPPGVTLLPLFCEDGSGRLWLVSSDQRLWTLEGDRFEPVDWRRGLAGTFIHYLAADRSGRVWIGTDRELAAWDGTRFERMTPVGSEVDLSVTSLLFTREGSHWVVANGWARQAKGRAWTWAPVEGQGLTGYHRLAISAHEDRRGGAWFAHRGKGLLHMRPDGTARRIGAKDGLPGERVTSWLEDREGTIWVGIERGGLARIRERRFRVIALEQGLSARAALSVCEDEAGSVWVGTLGGGLNRLRDGAVTSFSIPSATAGGLVFSVYPDQGGRLWVSADREDLFLFEGGRLRPAPWPVHGIKAILVDRSGRVWLGRKDGLSCIAEGRLTTYDRDGGIPRQDVRALAEDALGSIWVGSGDGAVYRIARGDALSVFRPVDGGVPRGVLSIQADDDGTLWVGTFRGGLLRLRDGHFSRITTRDGLPNDVICQILDDGQGRLWIGSHQGIFRVVKAALHAFAEGKAASVPCLGYGLSDGLPTLESSGNYQPSSWRGRDGRLWFTTTKGVVSVHPREMTESRPPPPVVIEEVLADGEPLKISRGRRAPATESPEGASQGQASLSVEIPPGRRGVEFRFAGLSLISAAGVRFRHKLEGIEADWVEAGSRRVAHYSHVGPGRYRFRVVACNSAGVWNEEGATLTLDVLPRFWETAWFLGLAGAAVVGGVAGAARHLATRKLRREVERLERQRALERERARIAKDIHDDLGAGLTQITLLSELARTDPPHEAERLLQQISETARELTHAMDEIVWAVNPRNDTLDSLTGYLCKLAQEHLAVAGIQCRLEIPASLPPLPVSSEVRHHLFLATKEALHNVVKHARAAEVRLRMELRESSFTLAIEDDGRGFAAEGRTESTSGDPSRSAGHGLDNIARRLAAVGGRCAIRSAPGRGTCVELHVPLA